MPSIAVIGTNIGCTLHVRALKDAGFDVTALVGRDQDRTAARAAHFGIPLASTSVERVLDSDIDAVVIATPPATHHPIAMAAFAAGKHVLCEKPLATTASLAREMQDAAHASGLVAIVEHQLRWLPEHFALRHLIAEGALGEPIQANATFDFAMTQRPGPLDVPDWWRAPETGGGWLRNWNSHGIDLIRFVLGEFAAVAGVLHPDLERGMSADDAYSIAFVLKNGAQGMMTGTCRSWDVRTDMRVLGTQGTASINLLAGTGLTIADADGTRKYVPPDDMLARIQPNALPGAEPQGALPAAGDGMYEAVHQRSTHHAEQVALCMAFARRIQDRDYRHPAFAEFADGVAALEVIEAVENAALTRRWVDIA